MGQLGFYFDMTACTSCKTCQIACNDKNNLKTGTLFRNVRGFEGGQYPNPWIYYFSTSCNHCNEPKCAQGCPTGALTKLDNGIVNHDADKCIGCKYCMWNCPYGVPQYIEETGTISKCDMCLDLISIGQKPTCVDACLMRCLDFGEMEDLKAKYGPDLVNELPILPSASITGPNILIKTKPCAFNKDFVEKED